MNDCKIHYDMPHNSNKLSNSIQTLFFPFIPLPPHSTLLSVLISSFTIKISQLFYIFNNDIIIMMMIMWIAALSARNAFQWWQENITVMFIMCDKYDYGREFMRNWKFLWNFVLEVLLEDSWTVFKILQNWTKLEQHFPNNQLNTAQNLTKIIHPINQPRTHFEQIYTEQHSDNMIISYSISINNSSRSQDCYLRWKYF